MLNGIKHKEFLYLGLILAAFFAFIFYLNISLNIWEDEVYSLKSTEGNIVSTIHQALNFEGQPPVYFIILNLWRHIDNSILFSRLFSLLSIVISALIIFKLSKIYIPEVNPIFTVLLFLCNPFIMWAGTEIRHYAFSILLSLLLLYFYIKGFLSSDRQNKYKAFYFLIAFIGFYTFYYFCFFLFANGIYILLKKRYKEFFYYCCTMVIIIVPLLFLYEIFMNQYALHVQSLLPPEGFLARVKEIGQGTQNYLFSIQVFPLNELGKFIYKLLISCIFIFPLVTLIVKNKIKEIFSNENTGSLVFSIIAIYFLYIIVLTAFSQVYFTERYLIVVYPLLTLFSVLFIWKFLSNKYLKKILSMLLLFIFLASAFLQYEIPVKKYDYKYIAKYLKREITDSRPILFYRGVLAPIFDYYYSGNSKLYPMPDSSCFTTNFLSNITTVNQFDSILLSLKSSKFCLVADEQVDIKYSVDYHRPMLYEYLKKKYTIEKDTNIYGRAKIYYLRVTEFKIPESKLN
jgi:uncharacterized membrane protein